MNARANAVVVKNIHTKKFGNFRLHYFDIATKVVESPFRIISGSAFVYRYIIHVEHGEHKTAFQFYSSIKDYERGEHLTKNGLGFAFYCFVSDAISGLLPLNEFEQEFGYQELSEAIKVHKKCCESLNKILSLGLSENDLYDLVNGLQEMDFC